ncbi:MAG: D-fructose-6-phosphate amidotransferase [Blastopirellula sp.]|nr:MAG: D-fructose-6-phosphate amidotransferase [Blastopirellula sp.]
MPAFVISRVQISDHVAMQNYMAKAPAGVAAHGGRYLVRTGDIECLEGTVDYDRVVVVQFPDREKALAWYNSEDYAPLRKTRWQSAAAHIIVVPGEE